MRWALVALLGASLGLAGCAHKRPPPAPPPPIRYVLEPAWNVGDAWFYPRESFVYDATGIASVIAPGHAKLTTDNETYDVNAMAAAMQAVQLPAIATVTNLETGREVTVRVNDRGPADPGRLIAVTPRVALLLGMTSQGARVRVTFDGDRSLALSRQVQGHAGELAIQSAPRGDVQQSELTPLAGTTQQARRSVAGGPSFAVAADAAIISVPLRLPEEVRQGYADAGTLMIDGGTFSHENAARRRLAAMPDADPRLVRTRAGGQTSFSVRAGPFADIAEADAALAAALRDGVGDARIVVDLP